MTLCAASGFEQTSQNFLSSDHEPGNSILGTSSCGFSKYRWAAHVKDSGFGYSIPGHDHGQKVIEVIQTNSFASCRLDVKLFPIYNKGNLTVQRFRSALQDSQKFSPDIINISWNTLYRKPYDAIVDELRNLSDASFLAATAGEDPGLSRHDRHEPSDTVMGRVSRAQVIGALSKEGRLVPRTFHGHLLTALPPPEGTLGSSFSAALFTAKLAETLCRNEHFDLYRLLENKRDYQQELPPLEVLFKT